MTGSPAPRNPLPPVSPVLCFLSVERPLLGAPDSFRGVRIESHRSLTRLLTKNARLTEPEVDLLARRALGGASSEVGRSRRRWADSPDGVLLQDGGFRIAQVAAAESREHVAPEILPSTSA